MSVTVSPVGHDAALFAVKRWHYSKTLPVPPKITLGVWENGAFIGVVIFSRGTAPAIGTPWGLVQSEVCELTRIALAAHDATVTKIVAICLRWLKTANPGLRLVVSFADPAEGHHGGIYQAGNWLYTGQSSPTKTYRDRAGKVWHSRQVSSKGVRTQFGQARRVPFIGDCVAINMPGKHRYLYPLDRAMRRKIAKRSLPFPPPCGRSVDSDTSGSRSEDAGATPADRSTERDHHGSARQGTDAASSATAAR